jgi:hypothetical protein
MVDPKKTSHFTPEEIRVGLMLATLTILIGILSVLLLSPNHFDNDARYMGKSCFVLLASIVVVCGGVVVAVNDLPEA